jgi:hypothetical protein
MKLDDYQTTEENFTPDNYEEVKDNPRYHHSRCGCNCEIKFDRSNDERNCIYYYKICHTHNVTCSKTGWELGWYGGTKSNKGKKADYNGTCKCGRKFIESTPLQLGLCPYCFQKEATDEQGTALYFWKKERNNEKSKRHKERRQEEEKLRQVRLDEQFKKKQELKNKLK